MKIRSGFVSNSSSSSFIVTFPKKPESVEELAEMMGECQPTAQWGSSAITSEQVVDYIWRRMNSPYEEASRYPYGYDKGYIVDEFYDQIQSSWVSEEAFELVDQHQNSAIRAKLGEIVDILYPAPEDGNEFKMSISLSDDCGDFEASLMCGNIFRNTKHRCTGRR